MIFILTDVLLGPGFQTQVPTVREGSHFHATKEGTLGPCRQNHGTARPPAGASSGRLKQPEHSTSPPVLSASR